MRIGVMNVCEYRRKTLIRVLKEKEEKKTLSEGDGKCKSEEDRVECWLRTKGERDGAWRWMLGPMRESATTGNWIRRERNSFSSFLSKSKYYLQFHCFPSFFFFFFTHLKFYSK